MSLVTRKMQIKIVRCYLTPVRRVKASRMWMKEPLFNYT